MAHSFVQAHVDETDAFRTFARADRSHSVLLVDTYDTATGIERAIEVARLVASGAPIDGFDVGPALGASPEAPVLDAVYNLVACDGRPVRKTSPGRPRGHAPSRCGVTTTPAGTSSRSPASPGSTPTTPVRLSNVSGSPRRGSR
jgi:nicotinate phosphoribosyltransferase